MTINYGTTAFRKVQIGKETVHGTAVPATCRLPGQCSMKDASTVVRPIENRGTFSKYYRSVITQYLAEIGFEGSLTWETFPYFGLMAIKGGVTPNGVDPESVQSYVSPSYTDIKANLVDENAATHSPFDGLTTGDYVYVGFVSKFQAAVFTMHATEVNDHAVTMTAEYSITGAAWYALSITDGTVSGGKTLAQSGTVYWTIPSDWVTGTVNSIADKYWVRFKFSGALAEAVSVTELNIIPYAATWDFTPNLSSINDPDSFTFEYGDNVFMAEAEYCIAKNLVLSGSVGEPIKVKSDLFGRQITLSTFTPGLPYPDPIEDIVASMAKIYIDNTWAGLGGTEKEGTMVDFSWNLETGYTPKSLMTGTKYFYMINELPRSVVLDLTLEMNDHGLAEYQAFQSQTKRFIRIEIEGSNIEGAVNNKLTLDLAGKYLSFDTLGERDGNDIVKIKFETEFDATSSKEWAVTCINKVGVLP